MYERAPARDLAADPAVATRARRARAPVMRVQWSSAAAAPEDAGRLLERAAALPVRADSLFLLDLRSDASTR